VKFSQLFVNNGKENVLNTAERNDIVNAVDNGVEIVANTRKGETILKSFDTF